MKLNKPFRIVLSIFVAVTMLTASTVTAFCSVGSSTVLREDPTEANNIILEQSFKTEGLDIRKELRKATDRVTPELMSKAAKDYRNLESVGLSGKALSIDHITADNEIVYAIKINKEITDYVTIEECQTSLVLDCYEGILHDTLKVCANGDYILNGRLVLFDYEKDANHNYERTLFPNARYCEYSKNPFKGSYNNYKKHVRDYSIKSINFREKIINTTASTMIALIASGLGLPGAGPGAGYLSSIALDLKAVARTYSPDSTCVSCKIGVYEYIQQASTDKYYQHRGTWYAKENYGGTSVAGVFYEYNYFS